MAACAHLILKQYIQWSILTVIALVLFIPPIFSSQKIIEITPVLAQDAIPVAKAQEKPATGQETANPAVISPVPKLTKDQIKAYVQKEAKKEGVNPDVAGFIVLHESNYDSDRIGDKNYVCPRTGKIAPSYGAFQISTCWHPEIPITSSTDLIFSTHWALQNIIHGHITEFSSFKFRDLWYN